MTKHGVLSLMAAVMLVSAPFLRAQDKPARLTFEVASIRLSNADNPGGFIKPLPGMAGYMVKNFTVRSMISLMYRVPMRQITGGPGWIDSERYDVEARADRAYTIDELHTMFQNLLADRFNLKFHSEEKEGNVYGLSVDGSGPKMKVTEGEVDASKIPIIPTGFGEEKGTGVLMSYLAYHLGLVVGQDQRPVLDMTGLKGRYDFTLSFAPMLPPDFPADKVPPGVLERPSIFDALKEQLGLKLTAQKGPVQYYAIDSIEKPSAN